MKIVKFAYTFACPFYDSQCQVSRVKVGPKLQIESLKTCESCSGLISNGAAISFNNIGPSCKLDGLADSKICSGYLFVCMDTAHAALQLRSV